jgi:FAD/FMN-containing dehydrogenase
MPARTSATHPIRVDFIPKPEHGLAGQLGMTFAPGKKAHGIDGHWDRDLMADLGRLRQEYATDVLVSLIASGASNGQTIAGAMSTGTHGSANAVGGIPDYVLALHIVGEGGDRERRSPKLICGNFTPSRRITEKTGIDPVTRHNAEDRRVARSWDTGGIRARVATRFQPAFPDRALLRRSTRFAAGEQPG